MLSRLLSTTQLLRRTALKEPKTIIVKRWSGHNTMEITPSRSDLLQAKNWIHFYTLLAGIPIAVITTIINIRANPELTEIPEGYEPRDWEYFRHPITRFMAKYLYHPMEYEHELEMALLEYKSESKIIGRAADRVVKVMSFYNDHRSMFFAPFYGEYFRTGRDQTYFNANLAASNTNQYYDDAFDPDTTPVPVEGYTKIDN